jgi:Protein of unknown function (DUF3379)
MDCLEFRRTSGGDPQHLPDDARLHAETCTRCAEHLRRLRAFDERIRIALAVPVGAESGPQVAVATSAIDRRRWMALAASIVGGVMIGTLLWVWSPRDSLARDLAEHVGHEPQAMASSAPADVDAVARVLERGGIRLRPEIGTVSYASSCEFRGHTVPHLVVQTDHGPVTVMVLRHERAPAPSSFDEQGYSGRIVPAGPGSIAVIGGAGADLDQVTSEVLAAVVWL